MILLTAVIVLIDALENEHPIFNFIMLGVFTLLIGLLAGLVVSFISGE